MELAKDAANAEDIIATVQMKVILLSMERLVEFKQNVRDWKKKTGTSKTIKNMPQHFIKVYKDWLEDAEYAKEKEEATPAGEANNALSAKDLKVIMDHLGLGEEPQPQQQQANISTEAKLCELVDKLTKKLGVLEQASKVQKSAGRQSTGGGKMCGKRSAQ